MYGRARLWAWIAAGMTVSGCVDDYRPVTPAAAPLPVQTAPGTPAPVPALPEPEVTRTTGEDPLLSVYYQRLQSDLVARGLMRTDSGGPDTPFTDTQLTANFVQIALHEEYSTFNGNLRAHVVKSRLHRWDTPLAFNVTYGPSVRPEVRQQDGAFLASYMTRLGRLTARPVTINRGTPNFHIYIVTEQERLAMGPVLRSLIPDIDTGTVNYAVNLPRDQLCVVIGSFQPDGVTYRSAVAIIRAEHPRLMRQACYHEELAQGLGLSNDSPRARPSIFNDDEEFAFLTGQDELLLRILYDPRLSVGMTADQATPIVRQIATELLGGPV